MADQPEHEPAGAQRRHWDTVVAHWALLGPPLRPAKPDIDAMQAAVLAAGTASATTPTRALLLGVTPEIADLRWPAGCELLALDRSAAMVEAVWPGDIDGVRRAESADWLERLPSLSGLGVAIGDGSYNTLAYADGMSELTRLLHAAMVPGATLVLRLFAAPARRETPATVLEQMTAGRIGNFHVAKFRLAMSMVDESSCGVAVDDVWRAWQQAGIDETALAAKTGWSPQTIDTIGMYRDSPGRLAFPTVAQMHALLEPFFEHQSTSTPDYEMGERCPTLVWRRR